MKADKLRDNFFQFFQSKQHKLLPSDSLIPGDDPTVLFTSAGMNQFKKQFLGQAISFPRVATSQKCLRTGDLDKVGLTSGHHTFFEMLGNFSFGDYFKQEAIEWAWEFLVECLDISEDKLWVSVYYDDQQAYEIWQRKIKVPENKIVKLGDKENFWPSEAKQKGPNGPCGPCSEIFFDQGQNIGCCKTDCSPACDCGRFIEVWNLVFTQFERKEGGLLQDLPNKNIDTGMGLERLAAVMQGVISNFETDLFTPIIQTIEEFTDKTVNPDTQRAFYAISDHIRAIVFAIADGVMPSNEERGYVIRNLIRRGLQHARSLGIKKSFLYKLVPTVALIMSKPYLYLEEKKEDIAIVIKSEEEKFLQTLEQTLPKFIEVLEDSVKKGELEIPAEVVFKFRDTYGLPWDVMKWAFMETGTNYNAQAVEGLLDEQRARSRGESGITDSIFIRERTFRSAGEFKRGICEAEAEVTDVHNISQDGEEVEIVLDITPFYPEQGGQIGDSGWLKNKNAEVMIYDTKKIGQSIVHYGKVRKGNIKIGDRVFACINKKRRLNIARNHTATHLLQSALRRVLGTHVRQQGSLVTDEKLRFDFTHFKGLTQEELARIEGVVNAYIKNNDSVKTQEMTLQEAKDAGALAFFGEKYGEKVRVVSVGEYSQELCGGTHLELLGDIGTFKIVSEGSVASGIRRIEAVTGDFANAKLQEENHILAELSRMLNVSEDKLPQKIEDLLSQLKATGKKLQRIQSKLISSSIDDIIREAKIIDGKQLVVKFMADYDADSLRKAVDLVRKRASGAVCALATSVNNKLFLAIGVTEDLVKGGLEASKIFKQISQSVGINGGGRADFAQGGGGDYGKKDLIEKLISNIIKGAK